MTESPAEGARLLLVEDDRKLCRLVKLIWTH